MFTHSDDDDLVYGGSYVASGAMHDLFKDLATQQASISNDYAVFTIVSDEDEPVAVKAKTDFSAATRSLVNEGVTNLASRLAEQLEIDAQEFRQKIVREGGVVRDTSRRRQYTMETPDNIMAALRLVCGKN